MVTGKPAFCSLFLPSFLHSPLPWVLLPLSTLSRVPSCCSWLTSMSSHISGHFHPPCIPLGGNNLRRQEDQNDTAVASIQKVGSEYYIRDPLQPRPIPKSNRQWKRPLCPKSSSALGSHDFQSSTIVTVCVIVIRERGRTQIWGPEYLSWKQYIQIENYPQIPRPQNGTRLRSLDAGPT